MRQEGGANEGQEEEAGTTKWKRIRVRSGRIYPRVATDFGGRDKNDACQERKVNQLASDTRTRDLYEASQKRKDGQLTEVRSDTRTRDLYDGIQKRKDEQ